MDRKIGLSLLFGGIGIILLAALYIGLIFGGFIEAPIIIKLNTINLDIKGSPAELTVPPELNRFISSVFVFMLGIFLTAVGGQLSALGIKIIGMDKNVPESKS